MTNELSNVAKFIAMRVDELAPRRSQKEIAELAGFPKPNIITMFKTGTTKVPLDRVIDLARGLDVSPTDLFELTLQQVYPDPEKNPVQVIMNGVVPSPSEARLILALRKHAGRNAITNDQMEKLSAAIAEILPAGSS